MATSATPSPGANVGPSGVERARRRAFDVSRSIRDYWRIFVHRQWWFIPWPILALGVAFVVFLYTPKEYQAEALVRRTDPVLLRAMGTGVASEQVAETVQVASARLTQWTKLIDILVDNKLNEALGVPGGADPEKVRSDPRWTAVIPRIQARVRFSEIARQRNGSEQYIRIRYSDRSPDLAQRICQTLAKEYQEGSGTKIASGLERTISALTSQLETLQKARLVPAEKELRAFQASHSTRVPRDYAVLAREMSQLAERPGQIQARLDQVRKDIEDLQKELAGMPENVVTETVMGRNPRLDNIERELDQRKRELELRLREYTEEHPAVQSLRQLIVTLEKERAALPETVQITKKEGQNQKRQEKEKEIENARGRMRSLEGDLVIANNELKTFQDKWNQELNDFHELTRLTDLCANLRDEAKKLEEAIERNQREKGTLEANESIVFELLEAARRPTVPSKPDPKSMAMLGLLAGVAVGAGFVTLREHLDHSLRTIHDAERHLEVEVLGTIGLVRTPRERRLRTARKVGLWLVLIAALGAGGWGVAYLVEHHGDTLTRLWQNPEATIHELTGAKRAG
jgi:uncharacterized protein involved in exopolysaccharide biosynthesis